MLLIDLYSNRQQTHEHREDYLSTALAELMRQDQHACRIVLKAVGLEPPPSLRDRVIHTQLRVPTSTRRPDIGIEVGRGPDRWRAIIECKLDAPPDLRQIEAYRTLGLGEVALLAPRAARPSWEGVPMGAWESIWDGLTAANERLDAHEIPPLRVDVMALMAHFGVAGLPRLTAARVRAAQQVDLSAAEEALRHAVRSLTPIALPDADDTSEAGPWRDDGALCAIWEADTAPKGLPLEGLGIDVERHVSAGASYVQARFWVCAPSLAVRCRAQGWDEDGDYWQIPLSDALDATATLGEVWARWVHEARGWLSALDVPVSKDAPSFPTLAHVSVQALVQDLERSQEVHAALAAWAARLSSDLSAKLSPRPGLTTSTRRRPTWRWTSPSGLTSTASDTQRANAANRESPPPGSPTVARSALDAPGPWHVRGAMPRGRPVQRAVTGGRRREALPRHSRQGRAVPSCHLRPRRPRPGPLLSACSGGPRTARWTHPSLALRGGLRNQARRRAHRRRRCG